MESNSIQPTSGTNRVLVKLRNSIDNGDFYEAHQMYRTLYFRYLNQKKYTELLELLYDGAFLFLEKQQQESGVDLTNLFIETLTKSNASPGTVDYVRLKNLFEKIDPKNEQRCVLIRNALQWSKTSNNEELAGKNGDSRLHQCIAKMYWKEKNFVRARIHFLYSSDGNGFALMLIEAHREGGYANEIDLFIAQVVLQCLCLHNIVIAQQTFENYTKKHPNIQHGPPYILPLLNFIWFLLKIITTGKLVAFNTLCQQYQPSIQRDPSYEEYLNKIGTMFFGVPNRRPQNSIGFNIGNLFQTLMNGLDTNEYDSDDEITPSSSNQLC